jgi:nucleoside-diphosphate-sugar epimerase
MRIFVTGVCGFVGSTLAECLLERIPGVRLTDFIQLQQVKNP